MNTTPKVNTSMHEYVNLFVEEYTSLSPEVWHAFYKEEERTSLPTKKLIDHFATWCIGPVKDDIFYGLQVSCSDLLPDHTEVVIVDLNECHSQKNTSNGMPDYFFKLEIDQLPRDSKKLQFKLREELPMDVRLKLIQAQDAFRKQLYAFK